MINSNEFISALKKVITPFIWAFVIAFFLNYLMIRIEKKFNFKRWVNILIVYVIFFGLIVLFFTIITPRVVESVSNLIKELPNYIDITQKWFTSLPDHLIAIDKYGLLDKLKDAVENFLLKASESLTPLLNKTLAQVINITSGLVDFILGSIIAAYILQDKEGFSKGFKRLNYAMFPKEKAKKIIDIGEDIKESFSKFLIGKIIDSTIIGIMCFIGCLILKIRYSLLISLIVGVTNMIPYFGPFVGGVIAVFITLLYSPIKALWVTIFIFALQQFDGLYLGPKILGIQVGLKPFWILTSIMVGGGFFGIWGMLFAVPAVAVIRNLLKRYVEKQYKLKGLNK